MTIDITSRKSGPAGLLSNFTAHALVLDGVHCASPEGALQAFKFDDPVEQKRVCTLIGRDAKRAGATRNEIWQASQTLWWKDQSFDRHGEPYQALLDRLFDALAKNPSFREALLATGDEVLTHSIGSKDPTATVLTEEEFCSRLMRLRELIRSGYR